MLFNLNGNKKVGRLNTCKLSRLCLLPAHLDESASLTALMVFQLAKLKNLINVRAFFYGYAFT